ncbi:hypothetical protein N9D23_13465, partial [Rubripirellula sp.]|nr:hypothetical protein [Rubripirellula sp.]
MNIAGVLRHSGGGISRARSAQKLRFEANRIYRHSTCGVNLGRFNFGLDSLEANAGLTGSQRRTHWK